MSEYQFMNYGYELETVKDLLNEFSIESVLYANNDMEPFQVIPYLRIYCHRCMEGGYSKQIHNHIIIKEDKVVYMGSMMGYPELIRIAVNHLKEKHGL